MSIIKAQGTTLSFKNEQGEQVNIGNLDNFQGLADSGTLRMERIPDIHFTMDSVAFNNSIEIMKNNPNPIGRYEAQGEIYEGEIEVYRKKQRDCEKYGARMIAPKQIINGVAIETDIDYIDMTAVTIPTNVPRYVSRIEDGVPVYANTRGFDLSDLNNTIDKLRIAHDKIKDSQ